MSAKTLMTIGMTCALAFMLPQAPLIAAVTMENVSSSTTPTPGQWNSNFSTSLAYGEKNHIPVIMFLGATGCSYANKGIEALKTTLAKEWIAAKKPILIFKQPTPKQVSNAVRAKSASEADDPDLYKSIIWIVNKSGVGDYPIFRVYWPKADGKSVTYTFTARGNTMPVKTPAGSTVDAISQKLIATFNLYVGDYSPDGSVVPSTPTDDDDSADDSSEEEKDEEEAQPAVTIFGTKNLSYSSCLVDDQGELVGVVTATAKKATKGVVSVTGKVTLLDGSAGTFSARTTATEHAISVKNTKFSAVALSFTDEAMLGTIDGYIVEAGHTVGGTLSVGTAAFSLIETVPSTNKNYMVVHEALPTNETLTVAARTLKAGKAGTVKWNNTKKCLAISEVNPSALSISYTPNTGMLKVTFKIFGVAYTKNQRTGEIARAAVTKYSASGRGFMVDGFGYGVVTAKGLGTFQFEIH